MKNQAFRIVFALLAAGLLLPVCGQEKSLAGIHVTETAGVDRNREFVEISLQISLASHEMQPAAFAVVDRATNETIAVQTLQATRFAEQNALTLSLVLPLAIAANQTRTFDLTAGASPPSPTDLQFQGEGTELIVENQFYRADLTKSDASHEQKEPSGQIREMTIKMGLDVLLTNIENRVHWAPNFKRPELEYYTTIAHWENPRLQMDHGAYLLRTIRQDAAPKHPEIFLTAVYKFYAGVPWFKFYSEMAFVEDLWVALLRNDEMTTDSIFTHLAFQRLDGEIVDKPLYPKSGEAFAGPIDNEDPWLCFYHAEKGFAMGSIRLRYDNTNDTGEPSPTYRPHTPIGEWEGKKYWNRRLIDNRLTHIPRGSRYAEENAYLLFKIGERNRFEAIRYWAERLRHPLHVVVEPMAIP